MAISDILYMEAKGSGPERRALRALSVNYSVTDLIGCPGPKARFHLIVPWATVYGGCMSLCLWVTAIDS